MQKAPKGAHHVPQVLLHWNEIIKEIKEFAEIAEAYNSGQFLD